MNNSESQKSEELKTWTQKILIVIFIAALGYILYKIESIVFILIISGFLTLMLHGVVEKGEKMKISPWLTLLIVYLITFFAIILVVSTVLPIFFTYVTSGITAVTTWINDVQIAIDKKDLASLGLHPYVEKGLNFIIGRVQIEELFDFIKENAGAIQTFMTTQVSAVTTGSISIIGNVGSAVTQGGFIAVMTFLMVLERGRLGNFLLELAPDKSARYIKKHFTEVQTILHAWIRGQLILGISIFFVALVGLSIIEWSFGASTGKIWTLAMIAGLMEFIPYIGPLIALIPALVVGLGFSWEMGLTILVFYIVMQQFENNFLVPYVMSKSLDLSPLYVFSMMLIGGILGGVLGIILAVPVAAILKLGVNEYIRRKKNIDNEENSDTMEKVPTTTRKTR